jgi:hypothetical protein
MDEMKIEIPEDLRYAYELSKEYAKSGLEGWSCSERVCSLIERVATLTTANAQLQAERDALKAAAERLKGSLANAGQKAEGGNCEGVD